MLFYVRRSRESLSDRGSLSRDLSEQTETRKPERSLSSVYSENSKKASKAGPKHGRPD